VSRSEDVVVEKDATASATASCIPGEIAVGGGAGYSGLAAERMLIMSDEPLEADGSPPEQGESATQWRAIARNDQDEDRVLYVTVLCARP
jgi:hypothetical protein